MTDKTFDNCSFCGKHKDQVKKLIVGTNVGICNECVAFCDDLLKEEKTDEVETSAIELDPTAIKKYLDQYVIGQDQAKIALSVAVANHYKRIDNIVQSIEVEKSNVLVLGPTGSGKTLLAKSIARYLDVPFVIADATSLTEAGYVGDDVETMISRLLQAAKGDVKKAERGIVFIDEIDKISRKGESASITRDVSGEGVQQALLKLVEGTKCRVPGQGSRKHPQMEMIEVDTSNILFIAGGAFVGLDKIIQSRVSESTIGFQGQIRTQANSGLLNQCVPDDLIKFGLIPEFIGRFVSYCATQELSKQQLIYVLTEIKNSYTGQYKFLFDLDKIELNFEDTALDEIAERTLKLKTGARGLHAEMERILQPHMFYARQYHKQNIKSLNITRDLVVDPKPLGEFKLEC
jgi:ATP-dependent Clp protease ATP-binding subunit ClpX